MLINPQRPHSREPGGVIRCGLQARLDVGPHGVPRGCQLSGQASDSGSFEAQLSDRPADRPGAQTCPGCAHRVVLLDEGRDLAGVFAAYPSALMPPDPCRDPGPGRVDDLHDHAPVALCDHPATRAARQLVARLNIEHQGPWGASHAHQMEALQTDEQITPITTIKRRTAAAGRVRHRPRSFEDRGGRSPLITWDLDLYPQPPTNTRSPTLNSEEPHKAVRISSKQCPGDPHRRRRFYSRGVSPTLGPVTASLHPTRLGRYPAHGLAGTCRNCAR